MQCQVFTLNLYNDTDLERLNAFLSQVVPIQVSSSLVTGNPSFWSVLVFFEGEPPTGQASEEKGKSEKPDKVFESSNPTVFEALRRWRSQRAKSDGVPAYTVANNAELETIIQANPKQLVDFEQIKTLSKIKREKYAREILQVLQQIGG